MGESSDLSLERCGKQSDSFWETNSGRLNSLLLSGTTVVIQASECEWCFCVCVSVFKYVCILMGMHGSICIYVLCLIFCIYLCMYFAVYMYVCILSIYIHMCCVCNYMCLCVCRCTYVCGCIPICMWMYNLEKAKEKNNVIQWLVERWIRRYKANLDGEAPPWVLQWWVYCYVC